MRGATPMIDLHEIDRLTGGKIGRHDVACPLCTPYRKPRNQRQRKLRIWRDEPSFATFHCVHCGAHGWARNGNAAPLDPETRARRRAEAAQREQNAVAVQLRTARWLWSRRRPITGSIVERYLREARRYGGPFPATLGYLPPRDGHLPAMIAAFGFATEPEPGEIAITDEMVRGVHLTKLAPDGSGKADIDPNKITIGRGSISGSPIVLAAVNDLLGLAITEGIEDGLTALTTGLGVWVAGSHTRMPALAAVVPDYVECCTIFAHDDDGKPNALELARALDQRGGVEVLVEGLSP
jgi:hypothetical protein